MTQTSTIAEVARRTGLSRDTLRWYEREGLIPLIARDAWGHRAYDAADLRMIELVVRLRRTGMPIEQAREFVALVREGAATHGRRLAVLEAHRVRVLAQLAQVEADLAAIDDKIDHYQGLIAAGRDCGDAPVTDPVVRARQRSRT